MRNHNNVRIVQKGSNNQMMFNVNPNIQYQAGEGFNP